MTNRIEIETALKTAMKEGNDVRKRTLRMILSAIKFSEIEKGSQLDEVAIAAILQKEIKIRKEAISDAQKANRPDLVLESEAEIKVVEYYLPKALSDEELRVLVKSIIEEESANSLKEMGKVIKIVMSRVQGRAPGDKVSALVKELLQQGNG